MIGLSTKLYDLDGNFIFYNKDINSPSTSDLNITKRVVKVKTLDSNVYIDDSGYVAGDTDIIFVLKNPSAALYNKIADVFKYHSFVYVSSISGVFLCVPYKLTAQSGNISLTFLTKESA